MTTGRMYMIFNFSGIQPMDAFIEIATGPLSFIISGTALILPLGVCDKTVTGRVGLYL